jgi:predicted peroxiredoxin
MKMLYVCATGPGDATRASIPFHIAVNGSLEVDQQPTIALVGDAADLIVGDTLESVEGVGLPALRDLAAKAREHEVPVYV